MKSKKIYRKTKFLLKNIAYKKCFSIIKYREKVVTILHNGLKKM